LIRIEEVQTSNWEGAFRGMRNPMNSWEKSDSEFFAGSDSIFIGENDLKLACSLIKAGSSHRKFMRQIFVSVDITAPLYTWKEFDTYKVATTSNSCSTMHKIMAKEFDLSDFSTDKMNAFAKESIQKTIKDLNSMRGDYMNYELPSMLKKNLWYSIIQLLPSSYNQKRTITLDYETLLSMYFQRKDHKLDEWRELCEVIKNLPYMDKFIKACN